MIRKLMGTLLIVAFLGGLAVALFARAYEPVEPIAQMPSDMALRSASVHDLFR